MCKAPATLWAEYRVVLRPRAWSKANYNALNWHCLRLQKLCLVLSLTSLQWFVAKVSAVHIWEWKSRSGGGGFETCAASPRLSQVLQCMIYSPGGRTGCRKTETHKEWKSGDLWHPRSSSTPTPWPTPESASSVGQAATGHHPRRPPAVRLSTHRAGTFISEKS